MHIRYAAVAIVLTLARSPIYKGPKKGLTDNAFKKVIVFLLAWMSKV